MKLLGLNISGKVISEKSQDDYKDIGEKKFKLMP